MPEIPYLQGMTNKLLATVLTLSAPLAFAVTAPELEGQPWTSYCATNDLRTDTDVVGPVQEGSISVEGDEFTEQHSMYGSYDCSGDKRLTVRTVYRLNEISGVSRKTATMGYLKTLVTPELVAVAEAFNAESECGFTEWRAGVAHECDEHIGDLVALYQITDMGGGESLGVVFGYGEVPDPNARPVYFWRLGAE